MEPLPSFAVGDPLMLLTNQTCCSASHNTDSGVLNPVASATFAGGAGFATWGTGASFLPQPAATSKARGSSSWGFTAGSSVGV